jgi:hypothetical protein
LAETFSQSVLLAARKSAAEAQSNEDVAKMILSGKFDYWPNVVGAAKAILGERHRCEAVAAGFAQVHPAGAAILEAIGEEA